MPIRWGQDPTERFEAAAAEGLLRAAIYLESQHKQRLSVSSPHRSVRRKRDTAAGPKGSRYLQYTAPAHRGEYPKLRTGHGRGSCTHEPTTAAAVKAEGMQVRVGFRKIIADPWGNYLEVLESAGWRGLLDTFNDLKSQLAALAKTA